MKDDRNIDELFRDKLLNYEKEPPAYLLENILSGVAGARRKRKIVFWRMAGVAAALLLAFVAGWQLNDRDGQEINTAVIVDRQLAPEVSSEPVVQQANVHSAGLPVAEMPQLAALKRNSSNRNVHNASNSTSSKYSVNALASESLLVAATHEPILLKSLKSISGLINSVTEAPNTLQEKKGSSFSSLLAEKSIDQQIMEQNKQMVTAQNKSKEKVHWLVGAQVSPEYNVSKGSQSKVYASNMLNASSNSVDLGGGISVEYKKGKRWSLQSGVYYSGLGQSSGNTSSSGRGNGDLYAGLASGYLNTPVNIDAVTNRVSMNSKAGVIELSNIPSGIVVGTNLEDKTMNSAVVVSNTRFIQDFEYIEIPLYLRYTLIDSRFDVIMLGGLSSNLLVGNQTFVEEGSGKTLVGKTQDMEVMNYSGTLGLGFKYGLSKRISLNVEPRVKYFLNSLNSNSSVTYKPYTIGVFTGLSYEF